MRTELKLFDQAGAIVEVQRSKNSILIPQNLVLSLALSALLSALCSLLLAPCSSVEAQQPKKVPRIGVLSATGDPYSSLEPQIEAFRNGLRELGYVEGKN